MPIVKYITSSSLTLQSDSSVLGTHTHTHTHVRDLLDKRSQRSRTLAHSLALLTATQAACTMNTLPTLLALPLSGTHTHTTALYEHGPCFFFSLLIFSPHRIHSLTPTLSLSPSHSHSLILPLPLSLSSIHGIPFCRQALLGLGLFSARLFALLLPILQADLLAS